MPERLKQAALTAPGPIRKWVLRPPFRLYRRLREDLELRTRPVEFDRRGIPLPPPRLRTLVAGQGENRSSVESWLHTGETDARLIRELVEGNGRPLSELGAILDFGCGSGRIARWWSDLEGPRLFGCDYNRTLVHWCRGNLPFMTVKVNGAEPPLPFEDDAYDLVYAISVFTHLPEAPQRRWLIELRRVLRPGGWLLFTVHGDRFLPLITEEQREAYARGELVVRSPELVGTNACGAFHPPVYVREKLLPEAGLELVESVHEDRSGTPNPASPMPLHDSYLVRKPAS
jgi:SAM-dependent methyltransferase